MPVAHAGALRECVEKGVRPQQVGQVGGLVDGFRGRRRRIRVSCLGFAILDVTRTLYSPLQKGHSPARTLMMSNLGGHLVNGPE